MEILTIERLAVDQRRAVGAEQHIIADQERRALLQIQILGKLLGRDAGADDSLDPRHRHAKLLLEDGVDRHPVQHLHRHLRADVLRDVAPLQAQRLAIHDAQSLQSIDCGARGLVQARGRGLVDYRDEPDQSVFDAFAALRDLLLERSHPGRLERGLARRPRHEGPAADPAHDGALEHELLEGMRNRGTGGVEPFSQLLLGRQAVAFAKRSALDPLADVLLNLRIDRHEAGRLLVGPALPIARFLIHLTRQLDILAIMK